MLTLVCRRPLANNVRTIGRSNFCRRSLCSNPNASDSDASEQPGTSTGSREDDELKEHVRKITEYYSQYKFGEQSVQEEEEYVITDDYGTGGVPFNQERLHAKVETFPISLQRPAGKDVIPLEDLVQFLRAENASDICVIRVPPDASYCDYLVIATMMSSKHAMAISERLRKVHKRRRNASDLKARVAGRFIPPNIQLNKAPAHKAVPRIKDADWLTIDLDRFVVHLMLAEARVKFDLESLWLFGPGHDEHVQRALSPESTTGSEPTALNQVDWDSYYSADGVEKDKQQQLYQRWLKLQQQQAGSD